MNYRALCSRRVYLLLAAFALLGAPGLQPAAAAPAARGERVLIPGVGEMDRAQAEAIAAQIHDGPRQLALQRAAARREGVLLTPAQLQAPLPPPERNAALVYARLTRVLKQRPLEPATDKVRGSVGVRVAHTPAEIERVRRLLAERKDVMALIHEAAGKPDCVFQRDWKRGMSLEFPEFSPIREAARLLTAESYFLARAGHYPEAVANQALAFRVAGHAANEPIVIAQLVGMACDTIALAGMESILALAGPNAGVAEAVRKAVADRRPRFRMRNALEGEVVMFSRMVQSLREGNSRVAAQMGLPGGAAAWGALGKKPTPAEQRRVQNETADAMEAYTLSVLRTLIAGCEKPFPARKPLLLRLLNLDKHPTSNFVQQAGNVLLPTLAQVSLRETSTRAQEEAVMAGAALLAYRGRRGSLPERLEQAMSPPATDPFSGRALKYRREGAGFVVYSAGTDGSFSGGKPGARRDAQQSYYRYPATPQPPQRK